MINLMGDTSFIGEKPSENVVELGFRKHLLSGLTSQKFSLRDEGSP